MSERVDDILAKMTLREKVALLAGSDLWHTVPIERLGIPALKMTDGPNGARGAGEYPYSTKAVCFPVGIALAATWNTELIERVGQALGQEARAKGAQVLLAPTVNIQRSPLGGRNFECYSEDPYLSARMAVAYIRGVQSQGVGATIKHFVCNDSEFERFSISVDVRERALREIYLTPFRIALREARPWAIMAAYNRVNGTPASEHPYLLTEILRDEWGFDGLAMSDWHGSKSGAPSVRAGLDLEMPGPTIWRGDALLWAIERGELDEASVEARARHVLELLERAGLFEGRHEEAPERVEDRPEVRALVREAAAEGIVLLKNERNVLPLETEKIRSLALIGPNAKVARIMGGGSARVNPLYAVTPFEAIVERAGSDIRIEYEPGCTNHRYLPGIDVELLRPAAGSEEHGLSVAYFNNTDFSGEPAAVEEVRASELRWSRLPAGVDSSQFSARLSGYFTPRESGTYTFGLISAGLSRLFIDGREVIDNWTQQQPGTAYYGMGSAEKVYRLDLVAGRAYALTIDYHREGALMAALRLGCLPPLPEDSLARAAALAARCDAALVFVGLSEEWESEGADRADMELVGEQVALIEKVAAANPNTVVVLNTGSPIAMNWLERVAAVVQAWYPGQECGHAIADVLFGDVNPSGKLPQTFPRRLEDNPAYLNYPGENDHVHYGEGLFVGYRYYDRKKIAPLFPFGFGLSYTTFDYGELRLSATEIGPEERLRAEIEITNSGAHAGKEVVQLYVRDIEASLQRPEKELKAFAKVALEPGERKTVGFEIGREALAFYDDRERAWIAEAGAFELLAGASSQDIRASATFRLTATSRFADREA